MAATVIGVQLMPTGSGTAQTNWNNLENPGTTGLRVADLIETSAGASTGYSLTLNGAFANSIEGAGLATSSPDPRFDVQVFRTAWYVGLADDDAASFTIGNLPVGATVTLEAAACSGNASRDTTFSLIGDTTVSELYDAGALDPVPQPTFLQTTVPANGQVTIRNIGTSTFAYNNGFILTVEQSGPSITTADDITSEGDTATFTLSGNTDAPVSATLNGTDVGTLTLVSGSTYSYTAPLLLDDANASLVVTVDSTTVSTTISYANSYPYVLTQHGTPNVNSIFKDTQFASNDPVEWGVVTDYDSGIVTVNHAAMDAAEDELNDVALHSTEVAAGTSTATYKYFVQESGATGTWQATIVVSGEGGDPDPGPPVIGIPSPRGVGFRKSVRSALRSAAGSSIH